MLTMVALAVAVTLVRAFKSVAPASPTLRVTPSEAEQDSAILHFPGLELMHSQDSNSCTSANNHENSSTPPTGTNHSLDSLPPLHTLALQMEFKDNNHTAYAREELAALAADSPVTRGILCPKCKQLIPQFASLDDKSIARILLLIREQRPIQAIAELRSITGAPLSWAKLWVQHSGRPDAVGTTAPCPYCGKPLVTALAKQCRYCLMDWHNPDQPKRLGTDQKS